MAVDGIHRAAPLPAVTSGPGRPGRRTRAVILPRGHEDAQA